MPKDLHPQTSSATASSISLRVLGYLSIVCPYLVPWSLSAFGVPIFYLAYVWLWLGVDRRHHGREIVQVREVVKVVESGRSETRRVEGLGKELHVRREGELHAHRVKQLHPSGVLSSLAGTPTSSRRTNVMSLVLNTLIALVSMDSLWTSRLTLGSDDTCFVRTISLTPHSSSLSLRMPKLQSARVVFRPRLSPHLSSVASPVPWQLSDSISLFPKDDWRGWIKLEHLSAGTEYEYRLRSDDGILHPSADVSSFNFTTFPDPRIARARGSHFRFIHAGSPQYYSLPYDPLKALAGILAARNPFRSFSSSRDVHAVRAHRLRQPAWRSLSIWLADMRTRTAWAPVEFALLGGDVELHGQKERVMGEWSKDQRRQSRQLMASQDVRAVYERLPVLSSSLHSPSQGSRLEPGALSTPETRFSYGNAFFFRLRQPFLEHGERDPQDWRIEVNELSTWLASLNDTHSLKFVISPATLSPFFGGSRVEKTWREAVLNVLAFVPNVVVLANSHNGFAASILRRAIVEFASPAFDQPPISPFTFTDPAPNLALANVENFSQWAMDNGEVTESSTTERVDRLLKYFPKSPGAKWTSIEVDTTGLQPRTVATLFDRGQPVWRLEVLGTLVSRSSKAVGGSAASFQMLLRKLRLSFLVW